MKQQIIVHLYNIVREQELMELREDFKSNSANPYQTDRPMNNQNSDEPYSNEPYVNKQMSYNAPPTQAAPQPYQMQQEIMIKQRGCLSHLCDGSLQGNARNNFIKKVYAILGMQLALTVGVCFISYYSQRFFNFQIHNYWLLWVSLGLLIVTQIPILCCQIGRIFPYNMLLLLVFTLCEAYMVSFITTVFAEYRGGAIVIVAACMTLAIVVALTLYAMFTRNDFSTGYGILFGIIAPFIMFGIFAWISWIPVLHSLYCALGACLFAIYLVIDTQLIVGGGRYSLSMDDYVAGAMILYIDIIQIFLYILELLGN